MIHDWHFLILICLHKIRSFSLGLSSEAISIDELGSIALTFHTYTTFFLLKFIVRKKLQVVVGYSFFVCLVNMILLNDVEIKFCCWHTCMSLQAETHI